ncbi:olfactory receptor 14I1-like [Cariama cristata]
MSNSSSITQFLLLAFAHTWELQLLHFWLFLGIYLAALLGNGLIITTIACVCRLHTPMYFFLLNLSLLDLGSISTTVPKSMTNSWWDIRHISYLGCATRILRSVLRIPSEQGQHKAFSTCLPHLVVVFLFVSTGMFAYLKPSSIFFPSLALVVSVLYLVVPPAVNPLIYSMRNWELKDALQKLFNTFYFTINKVPIIFIAFPGLLPQIFGAQCGARAAPP